MRLKITLIQKDISLKSGGNIGRGKINLRRKQFDELEARMGINTVKSIISVSRGHAQNTLDLKELITLINAYLILRLKKRFYLFSVFC